MLDTRFIFVEGIPGSGKTAAVAYLARRVEQAGLPAHPVWEDAPMRVSLTLPHPRAVWQDVSDEQYVERSLSLWRLFLAEAERTEAVTVCDGMLFHGNMADLLLMDAEPELLRGYVAQVLDALAVLKPAVIYMRRDDVAAALRAICGERGSEWEAYQTGWKLASPYAQRHGLHGFDGWVSLYQDYRDLCDGIFARLDVPKLAIRQCGEWAADYRDMCGFLGLPAQVMLCRCERRRSGPGWRGRSPPGCGRRC